MRTTTNIDEFQLALFQCFNKKMQSFDLVLFIAFKVILKVNLCFLFTGHGWSIHFHANYISTSSYSIVDVHQEVFFLLMFIVRLHNFILKEYYHNTKLSLICTNNIKQQRYRFLLCFHFNRQRASYLFFLNGHTHSWNKSWQ
jgi:hypothetical protein